MDYTKFKELQAEGKAIPVEPEREGCLTFEHDVHDIDTGEPVGKAKFTIVPKEELQALLERQKADVAETEEKLLLY